MSRGAKADSPLAATDCNVRAEAAAFVSLIRAGWLSLEQAQSEILISAKQEAWLAGTFPARDSSRKSRTSATRSGRSFAASSAVPAPRARRKGSRERLAGASPPCSRRPSKARACLRTWRFAVLRRAKIHQNRP